MLRTIYHLFFGLSLVIFSFQGALAQHNNTTNTTPEIITGSKLVSLCRGNNVVQTEKCDGYVQAIVDYHNLIKSLGVAPSIDFCITPRATKAEKRDVVVEFLLEHPEHLSFIAAPGVATAFYVEYPCE